MAIAFDAATDGGNNGGTTTSLTFAHTCTGSNGLLVVSVQGGLISDLISGVTYNGVAMSLAVKVTGGNNGLNRWNYLFYLVAPATGANNVVVSASATTYILAGAASYTGVNATGQPDATASQTGGSSVSSLTTSITTIANNCWAILVEDSYVGNAPPSNGTGATRRIYDAAFGTWGIFDSNGGITPAGAYSMTTNRTGAVTTITHVVGSFAPSGGGATGNFFYRRRAA